MFCSQATCCAKPASRKFAALAVYLSQLPLYLDGSVALQFQPKLDQKSMKKPAVLIIDDDPSHLRIYGWIIQSAGFDSCPALVSLDGVELPDTQIDLALLDYHLNARVTASEIAQQLRRKYQNAPILVLSDALMMPDDIAPFVDGFIRKGDPARLVETVSQTVRNAVGTSQ